MARMFRKFIYRFIIKLLAFIFVPRTEVRDIENLPKKSGFIIATNHISVLDPFIMLGIMKNFLQRHYMNKGRKFYGVGNIKLKKKLIFTFFAEEEFGFLPNTKEGSLRAVELLNEGNIVMICPEGGVNLRDCIIRGKKGVAYMAMLSGAPVIPAAFAGQSAATFFQGIKTLFKPRKLIFGSPMIFPMIFPRRSPIYLKLNHWLIFIATHKIMRRIARLAGKEYKMHILYIPYKKQGKKPG